MGLGLSVFITAGLPPVSLASCICELVLISRNEANIGAYVNMITVEAKAIKSTAHAAGERKRFTARLLLLVALTVLQSLFLMPAHSQSPSVDPAIRWSETAVRAEQALQEGQASSEAFEVLRAELATQRAEADAVVDGAGLSIRLLEAQLATLGPAPGKDDKEPDLLASRRKQLSDELAKAREPAMNARQASARANVLIEEIDRLVRSRSATSLFERKPSPLLPSSWEAMASDFGRLNTKISEEVTRLRLPPAESFDFVEDRLIPASLILLAALLVPVGLGHILLVYLERRIKAPLGSMRFVGQAVGVHAIRLVLSLIAAALVVIAAVLIEDGIKSIENTSSAAIAIAVSFVLANWIGNILYAPSQPALRLIGLSDGLSRACYWLGMAFAGSLGLEILMEGLAEDLAFSPGGSAALQTTSIVIGCLILFAFARILKATASEIAGEGPLKDDDAPFGPGFFRLASRFVQGLAVLSLLAAAVGYVPLARASLAPMMGSIAIFGLAFILHYVVMLPVRGALRGEQSSLELASMLVAVVILLISLPLVAIVWGAREAELAELWRIIQNGVDLGGARLSPKVLLVLVITFLLGMVLTRWLQRLIERMVLPKTRIDSGGRNAIRTGLGYVGFIISALMAISVAGLNLSNLAIIAGALSVGVGFGMQTIVSNFVSGIILLIERPIKEGDWIEVSGFSGIVRKIAVRSTRIETFDRHDVIIPNADLIAGTVKNMTLSSRSGRMIIPISVSRHADIDRIRAILLDTTKQHPAILVQPAPQVFLKNLGATTLNFELRCYLRDVGMETGARSELLLALNRAFADLGVEMQSN